MELIVNKEHPRMAPMCARCLHEKLNATTYPCRDCWNPPGDMFQPKPKPKQSE